MEIQRVAVVGAGPLGADVASLLSLAGLPVLLKDEDEGAALRGHGRLKEALEARVERGTLSERSAERCLRRVTPVHHYDWFDQVDLVIEAAGELIEVKHEIFRHLEAATRPDVILATNTSFLSITHIASVVERESHVIGLHFFHPAHVMKLVEVVPGMGTEQEVIDAATSFCEHLGKYACQVEECPSFLVNRLLDRYLLEALRLVSERVATIGEVERAAEELVMPMGPFALLDLTGVDVWDGISRFNHAEYGPRFESPPLLGEMVERGWLGRRSGLGFYEHEPGSHVPQGPNRQLADLLQKKPLEQTGTRGFDVRRLFVPMINEAFLAVQEGIVAAAGLDLALQAGIGMRRGPFQLAEEFGLRECLSISEQLFEEFGERHRPANLLKRLVWGRRTMVIR